MRSDYQLGQSVIPPSFKNLHLWLMKGIETHKKRVKAKKIRCRGEEEEVVVVGT